jgi:hypothetical protein
LAKLPSINLSNSMRTSQGTGVGGVPGGIITFGGGVALSAAKRIQHAGSVGSEKLKKPVNGLFNGARAFAYLSESKGIPKSARS